MDKAHISKNYEVCQGKIAIVEVYFWRVNLNGVTFSWRWKFYHYFDL